MDNVFIHIWTSLRPQSLFLRTIQDERVNLSHTNLSLIVMALSYAGNRVTKQTVVCVFMHIWTLLANGYTLSVC